MQFRSKLYIIPQLERDIALLTVHRPVRQPLSIGIARGREVHPIGGHDVRQLSVAILVGARAEVEIVEYVRDLRRMICPQRGARGTRRHSSEVIKVGIRLAGLASHPNPGPHLPPEYKI